MFHDGAPRFGLPAALPPRARADLLASAPITAGERDRAAAIARLIKDLPDDGAVVVVHSPAAVILVREAIRELRGTEVSAQTRVVAAPSIADERRVTAGLSLPVFRDPFVDEQREHARAVMQAWRQ